MRKLYIALGLAVALGASSAQAGMTITAYADYNLYSSITGGSGGGEFRAVSSDLNVYLGAYSALAKNAPGSQGSGGFQTFCIEASEQFNPGVTYNLELSDAAKYNNNPPNTDPISIGTAFLYSQFAKGILTGYDYNYDGNTYGGPGGNRTGTAGDLQRAIWLLEQESGGSIVSGSWVESALKAQFGSGSTLANWQADANGAFSVKAMNLFASNDNTIQDMLVMVPEPTTYLAGALLALPVGINVLRMIRRKRIS